MRGSDVVTKLSKMEISRIAICKNPADQDAMFVVVKSVDDEAAVATTEGVAVEKTVEEVVEELTKGLPVAPVLEKEEVIEEPKALISQEVQEYISKAIADGIQAAIEKSPVLAHSRVEDFSSTENTEGKAEVQSVVKNLVSQCNESKIVPKSIRKTIDSVAKYHGVDGPDLEGDAEAFSEVAAELRAVVEILKGLAVAIAKPAPAAPEAPAPAAKPAAPAKAVKSMDDIRIQKLEQAFEKARFSLLQAIGHDPTPLTE